MNQRPYFIVNVEAVIKHNDQFLLIRRSTKEDHSPGTLSLPGGKIDQEAVSPGALERALRREIEEEVGLLLGRVSYLESKTFLMDTKEWCLSVCFFCEDFSGMAIAKSEDEVDEVLWLKSADLHRQADGPSWTQQSIRLAESQSHKS